MLGWSIRARACRSASKRATTCAVSMPGLMIFSATLRRTGLLLLGDVDDAHAPLADLLQQLVRADPPTWPLGRRRRAPDIAPHARGPDGGGRLAAGRQRPTGRPHPWGCHPRPGRVVGPPPRPGPASGGSCPPPRRGGAGPRARRGGPGPRRRRHPGRPPVAPDRVSSAAALKSRSFSVRGVGHVRTPRYDAPSDNATKRAGRDHPGASDSRPIPGPADPETSRCSQARA